jgi:hypothetical protein
MQWVNSWLSVKPQQTWPINKSEEGLIPAAGKKCTGVIPKVVPSVNRRSVGILLREAMDIPVGKHFEVDTLLSMLS